jgi:predicted transcriptional regulator
VPTLSIWLRNLIEEMRDDEQQKILDLYLRCRQQNEIAKEIGRSEPTISRILQNSISEKMKEIASFSPESLQFFNHWQFPNRDPRFGLEGAAGQIPGQIVENTLYYWTQPFDIVVDPMAGGGTTIDVCRSMYRRYRAYDINPLRDDIQKWDITQGFPEEARNCDFVFLDPPYYKKIDEKMSAEAVASMNRDGFMNFIGKLAKDCYRAVKKNGIVALLMSDFIDYEKYENSVFAFQYTMLFEATGLRAINHVSVPLSTQQRTGFQVNQAKDKKILLEIARDLFIFRKNGGGS